MPRGLSGISRVRLSRRSVAPLASPGRRRASSKAAGPVRLTWRDGGLGEGLAALEGLFTFSEFGWIVGVSILFQIDLL